MSDDLKCGSCFGTGQKVEMRPVRFSEKLPPYEPCPSCGGTGVPPKPVKVTQKIHAATQKRSEKNPTPRRGPTEAEAAAYVGVTTLEFDRLRRSGILCEPIPGTKLWDRTELYRSVAQCRPQSSRRVG
jgi:hypothetical protein